MTFSSILLSIHLIRNIKKQLWRTKVTKRADEPLGWIFNNSDKWLWFENTLYIWSPEYKMLWVTYKYRSDSGAKHHDTFLWNEFLVSKERTQDWIEVMLQTKNYKAPATEDLEAWIKKE